VVHVVDVRDGDNHPVNKVKLGAFRPLVSINLNSPFFFVCELMWSHIF
jgi:hypothetical protein